METQVVITDDADGWHAHGHLRNNADFEPFAFLCDLDPVFTLRFDDDSTIAVAVDQHNGSGRFELMEYTGPAHRKIDYRIELPPPGSTGERGGPNKIPET